MPAPTTGPEQMFVVSMPYRDEASGSVVAIKNTLEGMTARVLSTIPQSDPLGLTRYKDSLLSITTSTMGGTTLSIFDAADLSPRENILLTQVYDAHSICVQGDDLYIVATGTDEIVRTDLQRADGITESIYYAGNEKWDRHHLNSIAIIGGKLMITGFGTSSTGYWRDARNGFVRDIATRETVLENIHHPHSLTADGNGALLCESLNSRVIDLAGNPVWQGQGYIRGLSVRPDGILLIGESEGRHPEGIQRLGQASIHCFNRATLETATIPLGQFGPEVYDIVSLR